MTEPIPDTWDKVLKRDRQALRELARAEASTLRLGTETSFAMGTVKQWQLTRDRLRKLGLIRTDLGGTRLTKRGHSVVRWARKHDPAGLSYWTL